MSIEFLPVFGVLSSIGRFIRAMWPQKILLLNKPPPCRGHSKQLFIVMVTVFILYPPILTKGFVGYASFYAAEFCATKAARQAPLAMHHGRRQPDIVELFLGFSKGNPDFFEDVVAHDRLLVDMDIDSLVELYSPASLTGRAVPGTPDFM